MAVKGLSVRRSRLGEPHLREQPAGGAAVAVHGPHLVPGGGHAALRRPHAAGHPAHVQVEDWLGNEGRSGATFEKSCNLASFEIRWVNICVVR